VRRLHGSEAAPRWRRRAAAVVAAVAARRADAVALTHGERGILQFERLTAAVGAAEEDGLRGRSAEAQVPARVHQATRAPGCAQRPDRAVDRIALCDAPAIERERGAAARPGALRRRAPELKIAQPAAALREAGIEDAAAERKEALREPEHRKGEGMD